MMVVGEVEVSPIGSWTVGAPGRLLGLPGVFVLPTSY